MSITSLVILLIKTKLMKNNNNIVIIPTAIYAVASVHTSMSELSERKQKGEARVRAPGQTLKKYKKYF